MLALRHGAAPALKVLRSRLDSRRLVIRNVSVGPEPPVERKPKPQWLRYLEEDKDVDDDVAELLRDTDGDEDKIRAKMQAYLNKSQYIQEKSGSDTPPNITFDQVDPFNLWVWLWFTAPLTAKDQDLLDGCLRSWYVCGKFGGFNSTNLQVYYAADNDTSFLEYNSEELASGSVSLLHEMGELEVKGRLARVRVDMGTADELALDVLLNMLMGYSQDIAGIRKIQVGGDNEAWPAPVPEPMYEGGEMPKVSIDPLRAPTGMGDELALLDELEEFQRQQEQHRAAAAGRGLGHGLAVAAAAGVLVGAHKVKQRGGTSSSSLWGRQQ